VLATYNGPSGVVIGDGFTGVAVRPSNGQVFVVDGLGTNRVYRIDPNTGAALGFFGSPTSSDTIDGLEFVGDDLYATKYGNSQIVRISPETGALIGTLPTTFGSIAPGGLTYAGGAFYSHGFSGNLKIARRDPTTGAILSEFDTPNNEVVKALATDGVSLYAASDSGIIYRCALDTGTVLDSRNLGIPLDGLGGPVPIPEPAAGLLVVAPALYWMSRARRRTKMA
jgi:DNA-binding beta-propeller fold protein YncE